MKKHFPEGTFVAMPLRVLSIIQLCLVFTYIAWVGGYPFLGEVYEIKVAKLKYESVLMDSQYEGLSEEKKASIMEGYNDLQGKAAVPFMSKIGTSLRILFFDLPLFSRVWVLLSILLPLFILLRVEGAIQCIWLLPIVVTFGFLGSLGEKTLKGEEERLFPTEKELVALYRGKPLEGSILQQKEQLQMAWERYLVKVWKQEEPSADVGVFEKQKAEGLFLFNVARIEAFHRDEVRSGYRGKHMSGAGLWLLYLVWNLLWAGGIAFAKRERRGVKDKKRSYSPSSL